MMRFLIASLPDFASRWDGTLPLKTASGLQSLAINSIPTKVLGGGAHYVANHRQRFNLPCLVQDLPGLLLGSDKLFFLHWWCCCYC